MKRTIVSLCFGVAVLSSKMDIQINSNFGNNNQNIYRLNCNGGQGTVKYYVDGLPAGVNFDGSSIVVSNFAKSGAYTIRIKAVDESGASAQRVITLSVSTQYSNNQAGLGGNAGNAGGFNGNLNGAAGSGGAPGGGNGAGQVSPSDAKLSSVLSTYSSISSAPVQLPRYGNRYPENKMPTGADPNIPNTNILAIQTNQARPTPANRNPITVDDVTLRAASDRHQNAIKGITNLLKIIDQARANKDRAQSDMQIYTQAYNDAVNSQRAAQNDIISVETRTAQITSAISTLSTTIDDLKAQINNYANQADNLTRQKNGLIETINTQQGQKAVVLNKLKALDGQVAQRVRQLSDKNSECQQYNTSLNRKTIELANAQKQLQDIQSNRRNAVTDITSQSGIVQDLRNKLLEAEQKLASYKIRLADIESRKLVLPGLIQNIIRQLDVLRDKARACAQQSARIQALIDKIKKGDISGITNDVNGFDTKININRTRVAEIDAKLAAAQGPLADLRSKLAQATNDLAFIRSQKSETDQALRRAYQNGNDSNNKVAFAKQNLDAVCKRFQDQSKIVSDATLNLQRIRAQQALARQGLQQIIAQYSDALPYSIVPNGNLSTNPGTPYGNNPSGSPLGPIRTDGNGAPGVFKVSNWVNYLSTAYGAGVNPNFPGSVTELFPFNFLSTVSGNMSQGTNVNNGYGDLSGVYASGRGGCGGNRANAAVVSTTGVVVDVRPDNFDVKADDGKIYTIQVSPCTQFNANKAGYRMINGDRAIFKGWKAKAMNNAAIVVDGGQVTCLK